MIIAVSGTPATGKTFIAKILAKKLKADYLDLADFIKKYHLSSTYDRSLQTSVVNLQKLNKAVLPVMKRYKKERKNLVIDSHLSHYLSHQYISLCIITKCNLKVLRRRLKQRHYSQKKIKENMNAEIFEVCLLEAIVNKHRVKVIDTSKRLKASQISRLL